MQSCVVTLLLVLSVCWRLGSSLYLPSWTDGGYRGFQGTIPSTIGLLQRLTYELTRWHHRDVLALIMLACSRYVHCNHACRSLDLQGSYIIVSTRRLVGTIPSTIGGMTALQYVHAVEWLYD
jgi:hypothetical protein